MLAIGGVFAFVAGVLDIRGRVQIGGAELLLVLAPVGTDGTRLVVQTNPATGPAVVTGTVTDSTPGGLSNAVTRATNPLSPHGAGVNQRIYFNAAFDAAQGEASVRLITHAVNEGTVPAFVSTAAPATVTWVPTIAAHPHSPEGHIGAFVLGEQSATAWGLTATVNWSDFANFPAGQGIILPGEESPEMDIFIHWDGTIPDGVIQWTEDVPNDDAEDFVSGYFIVTFNYHAAA